MSDADVIKRIVESKAEQNLREHLNSGKDANSFADGSDVKDKVVSDYNQKSESEQQQFRKKGWING